MKKKPNDLVLFVIGLVMLIVGLFIFSQKVMVSSSFLGGFLRFGGIHFSNGLIMVPFIAGIIWLFAGGKLGAKILTGAGVLFVVVTIIMTTNIRLVYITLYEWVLILVLIFGGCGMLLRVLFATDKKSTEDDYNNPYYGYYHSKSLSEKKKDTLAEIEKEIEQMKKNQG